jgi:hypothetical protein
MLLERWDLRENNCCPWPRPCTPKFPLSKDPIGGRAGSGSRLTAFVVCCGCSGLREWASVIQLAAKPTMLTKVIQTRKAFFNPFTLHLQSNYPGDPL